MLTGATISLSNAIRAASLLASIALASALACCAGRSPAAGTQPTMPIERPLCRPFLNMPPRSDGALPRRLSQTGAFSEVAHLAPSPALIAFTVNAPLWSDGARKQRWMALPHQSPPADAQAETIAFAPRGEWRFPAGTVFVKHFALPIDERDATRLRRLETRLLVRDADGGVYGATYRWRADASDAELLEDALDEDISITTVDGGTRTQRWHYPSRAECLQCHNPAAGGVLGVKTRQLNGDATEPASGNQLRSWNRLGLFRPALAEDAIGSYDKLVAVDEPSAPLALRVRSYLDANCAHCHRPDAVGFANFDARYDTPLAEQNLINGRVIIDHGIDRARNLMPRDPWRSMVLIRMEALDELRMPPLARNAVDHVAVATVRAWIGDLPGKPALAPALMTPAGGAFAAPLAVTLRHDDPLATLHYTTDGSLPDRDSPRYLAPFTIDGPTTVRVKAFRDGFSSSVVVNATFVIERR